MTDQNIELLQRRIEAAWGQKFYLQLPYLPNPLPPDWHIIAKGVFESRTMHNGVVKIEWSEGKGFEIIAYRNTGKGEAVVFYDDPIGELEGPWDWYRPHLPALVRGIFKLGQSIAAFEERFGSLLSEHERLECKLEMPREFWPEHWSNTE